MVYIKAHKMEPHGGVALVQFLAPKLYISIVEQPFLSFNTWFESPLQYAPLSAGHNISNAEKGKSSCQPCIKRFIMTMHMGLVSISFHVETTKSKPIHHSLHPLSPTHFQNNGIPHVRIIRHCNLCFLKSHIVTKKPFLYLSLKEVGVFSLGVLQI